MAKFSAFPSDAASSGYEQAAPVARPDEAETLAERMTDQLRGAMIKLCFAGLLAVAVVFQIFTLVQIVADGTQQITKAAQGLWELNDIVRESDGLATAIEDVSPRRALAVVSERQTALDVIFSGALDRAETGQTFGVDPTQLLALRAQAEGLFDQARASIGVQDAEAALAELRMQSVAFREAVHQLQDAQDARAQLGLGTLAQDARFKVYVMVLFLAATVFLLSTVLVTGFREMARRQEIEQELRAAMAEVNQVS
jgi:hypothetical protein